MTAVDDRPGGVSIRRRVLADGTERFDVRARHPAFHVGTFPTRWQADEIRHWWNWSLRFDSEIVRERAELTRR